MSTADAPSQTQRFKLQEQNLAGKIVLATSVKPASSTRTHSTSGN
jgi:hypothetical protein